MKPVFESATSCKQIKMTLYGAQTLLPVLLWIPSRNGAIFLCIQKKEAGGKRGLQSNTGEIFKRLLCS